jgi:hypothetical protein
VNNHQSRNCAKRIPRNKLDSGQNASEPKVNAFAKRDLQLNKTRTVLIAYIKFNWNIHAQYILRLSKTHDSLQVADGQDGQQMLRLLVTIWAVLNSQ